MPPPRAAPWRACQANKASPIPVCNLCQSQPLPVRGSEHQHQTVGNERKRDAGADEVTHFKRVGAVCHQVLGRVDGQNEAETDDVIDITVASAFPATNAVSACQLVRESGNPGSARRLA